MLGPRIGKRTVRSVVQQAVTGLFDLFTHRPIDQNAVINMRCHSRRIDALLIVAIIENVSGHHIADLGFREQFPDGDQSQVLHGQFGTQPLIDSPGLLHPDHRLPAPLVYGKGRQTDERFAKQVFDQLPFASIRRRKQAPVGRAVLLPRHGVLSAVPKGIKRLFITLPCPAPGQPHGTCGAGKPLQSESFHRSIVIVCRPRMNRGRQPAPFRASGSVRNPCRRGSVRLRAILQKRNSCGRNVSRSAGFRG